ncbi:MULTISPECIES: hypothetical protein [Prochlorococcus]|uniref:Uncharacterized protein n=1 Tax=Prochlorococcus marinus (strain SARG / CCMP1375 / SS120) TaxID=167539 RepID=Q7VB25_PROMA|nr:MULTISPECIES: hypothetical protein [Prochlorococcus]AAQ00319.1 Predicted protein [Prochlorococcus marinus subsp. marinus str. CCMP1375]KGG10175.1 hypothetical protein EV04_1999 [Prochlorococcus marinus str. LG]KGG22231.1 hypothetical protein EV08_0407 [Prochlorococcus marinus str. SS2]KGG24452.1 hypothetical protein EV09_0082 [Prochlorococcus marinus str. SS35]KGG33347.1 hypothetical protein EV10_0554 [Prochlorococcus marinus str. SS51]
MEKETLLRLAQPIATFALAMSIATLPFIAKASGVMQIEPSFNNKNFSGHAIRVKLIK